MTNQSLAANGESMLSPLRYAVFRRFWGASVLSNFGAFVQSVGAAWTMTQLSSDAGLVTLVQTALLGPTLVLSLAAGAIADMYDRRKVALIALSVAFVGAAGLAGLAHLGALTPMVLLAGCVVIGAGSALLAPAWQASVSELVPAEALRSAVALNDTSYNIARSLGPAIGGLIVAAAGGPAAFATNMLLYLPLSYALFRWRRVSEPTRLPPEGFTRAIISGARYVFHSPAISGIALRALATGLIAAAIPALLPLIARDVLHGGPQTFGLLLGAFGIGAVSGAFVVKPLRRRLSAEHLVRASTLAMSAAAAGVALSPALLLTGLALLLAGAGWMLTFNQFTVIIQMVAPRWVAGRALGIFQAAAAGGAAIGSWLWGQISQGHGVSSAMLLCAISLIVLPLAGVRMRLADDGRTNADAAPPDDPEVALALTDRSGPVRLEVEYAVDPSGARQFYMLMQKIRTTRCRAGAYDWSIARDVARPDLWIESYSCPTWMDYLRQRTRHSQAEHELLDQILHFHDAATPPRVRRLLERPFGSVRWQESVRDPQAPEVIQV